MLVRTNMQWQKLWEEQYAANSMGRILPIVVQVTKLAYLHLTNYALVSNFKLIFLKMTLQWTYRILVVCPRNDVLTINYAVCCNLFTGRYLLMYLKLSCKRA